MNRRAYLATVGTVSVASIAGCGGSGTTTETEEEESIDDYVELLEHSFQRPPLAGGIDLYYTVENVSDEELERIEFDSALFVENERVDDSTSTISGLGAGIQQEEDMIFSEVSQSELTEITEYTITIRLPYRDEIEETYEFDDFEIEN